MSLNKSSKIAAYIGIAAALAIAAVKGIIYVWTGSQAVFADWIESVVHIWVACLMALSISYSAKPPDHEHRYGHGKITYFSAALEGLLVIIAGIAALWSAAHALWQPSTLNHLGSGMLAELLVVLANSILGRYLLRVGHQNHNIAIKAHGQHVLADMWTTVGVVLSLACTWITGWLWLDAAVGGYFGIHIIWMGIKIGRDAYRGLMERTDDHMHDAIVQILNRAVEERCISDYHQLRHRRVNECIWIEVHMLFDGSLSLQEVHRRATLVEVNLIEHFQGNTVNITSHLEPITHQEAHPPSHPESIPLY